MPNCLYRDFEIELLGDAAPYTVTATYEGRSALGRFAHDAQQPMWREYLAALTDSRRRETDADLIPSVGSLLFDELMSTEIRQLWIEARSALYEPGAPALRIRLMIRPPAVAALPWESLHDAHRQQPLGADVRFALVRVANQAIYVERPRPLETVPPLKILLVAVDEPDGLDSSGEIASIERHLAPLRPRHVDLRLRSGRLGIHDLRSALQAERPDVLHVISHGYPEGLLLWNQDGPDLVSDRQIQAVLRQVDSVKLVFLNACLAGQPDRQRPFASVAHRLLQTGIPAVVAMQFEIADHAASAFAGYLYEALVNGPCPGAVDTAVGIARNNLYISNPACIDYITPVLWLNVADGVIVRTASQAKEQTAGEPDARQEVEEFDPPPIRFDLAEKETWLNALPETIPHPGLDFDYQRRKRNLAGLLERLRQDQVAQAAGKPIDVHQLRTRLEIFDEERQYLDRLLQSLGLLT